MRKSVHADAPGLSEIDRMLADAERALEQRLAADANNAAKVIRDAVAAYQLAASLDPEAQPLERRTPTDFDRLRLMARAAADLLGAQHTVAILLGYAAATCDPTHAAIAQKAVEQLPKRDLRNLVMLLHAVETKQCRSETSRPAATLTPPANSAA